MAEIWVAGATLAYGVYAGNEAKKANEKGLASQESAAAADLAEQRRQFDINQANQQPWLQFGQENIGRMNSYLSGDRSGFENSPDYQFRLQQSLQAQERGAAARGGFMGGGADADRIALAQGLAGQAADNYYAKISNGAGQGYQAANSLGQYGMQYANNIGNVNAAMADARASSYNQNAAVNQNMVGNIIGTAADWYGQQKKNNGGGTGWYLGNRPGEG